MCLFRHAVYVSSDYSQKRRVIRNNTHAVKRSFKYSVLKSAPNTKYGNGTVIVRIKFPLILLFIIGQLSFASAVNAESNTADKGWFTTFTDNVAQTWNEPEHYDLYIPAITWHARFAYDKEKLTVITSVRGWPASVSLAGMKR